MELEKFEAESKLVKLDRAETCALAHGFAKNPKAVSQLMELVEKKKLKLSADVLIRSANLKFPHDDEIETAFYQIAAMELKRLEGGVRFECTLRLHSLEEHKKALQSVIEKLSKPVN